MLVLHCAGHDRTRAWAVASALLLSAVGTCAIAAEDLARGRFERGEVLIPVFAAVCAVIALRVLGSAPRQKGTSASVLRSAIVPRSRATTEVQPFSRRKIPEA